MTDRMHAKHDYNPIKTAYPIESIPNFDEDEYPETPNPSLAEQNVAAADNAIDAASTMPVAVAPDADLGIDPAKEEEDFALLAKTQQPAFHQRKDFQGAQAYQNQAYEPGSTELESTISWTLMIGCVALLIILLLIGAGLTTFIF